MPRIAPLPIAVLLVLTSVQASWAQTRLEVIPAAPEPEIEVREDGATILRGDRIPEFLAVQNFFLTAHGAAQVPDSWQYFLKTVGIDPSSKPAAILLRGAEEVWKEAAQGGVSPFAAENGDERLVLLVAKTWAELRSSLLATNGSTGELEAFVDDTVRRQTTLIVPPHSEHELTSTTPNLDLEAAFQEALEQFDEDGRDQS